jgi:hypothetical protein
MFALVSISPPAVVTLFSGSRVALPGGSVVEGVAPGWSDKNYRVADVVRFSTPDGYRILDGASPAYEIDGDVVRETFETEAIPAPAAPSARSRALAALSDTDAVAIRCFKAGVAFPDEWRVYVEQLREIVRADSGELPKKPAFPEGT